MRLESLQEYPLVYLATPYSKYPRGLEHAFRDAAALAAELMLRGLKVYSPIAHTHPLAVWGDLDPLDHSIWLPFDAAMMAKADALLVAHMESWDLSYGIGEEIKVFKAAGKPVYHLDAVLLTLVAMDLTD